MDLQSNPAQFLKDLEEHFGRHLAYPAEVGSLMQQASDQGLDEVFRDAIFHAKFVTKTRELMGRIGRDGEGFDKLSLEFQNSIEKSSALLKTIVKESPEDFKQRFVGQFFGLDQESLGNLLRLLDDLSWVKNFELDERSLPLTGSSSRRPSAGLNTGGSNGPAASGVSADIVRIRNGAVLGIVLMILFVVIDPPVTFLGWGISLVVGLLLLYIARASNKLGRRSDTSH